MYYLKNLKLHLNAMSLIEIIVTITIVFILGTMSVYSYQEYKVKATLNGALATAEQNKLAINGYYAQNKTCPSDRFVNQTLNNSQCTSGSSTPCVASIYNTGCNLNLVNGNNQTIMSFVAKLSSIGDFQYFCVLSSSNSVPKKYLSVPCNGLPSASSGYIDP